jgi:RNA polymerase sigma-70 factor (ECF subfamily)
MSESASDIAAILTRVAQGDEAAAAELVTHGTPLVLAICRAHRPRHLAVEDLAQEVFLTMFMRLDRYEARPGVPFLAWLSRLAVNVCLDALRAESRRPRLTLGDEAGAWLDSLTGGPGPGDDAASAAKELVDSLLAELAPADRLVLTLLDLEERSVAEIAQLTGWSQTATKVRAFRARRRLKRIAEERHAHEAL